MHHRSLTLRCIAALCLTLIATTPALAQGAPHLVPVIDGSGALGEATGPNGSMNGNLYVPERQATRPQATRPAPRFRQRGYGYQSRSYRRGYGYRHYRHRYGRHAHRGALHRRGDGLYRGGRGGGYHAAPDRRRLERAFGD